MKLKFRWEGGSFNRIWGKQFYVQVRKIVRFEL